MRLQAFDTQLLPAAILLFCTLLVMGNLNFYQRLTTAVPGTHHLIKVLLIGISSGLASTTFQQVSCVS